MIEVQYREHSNLNGTDPACDKGIKALGMESRGRRSVDGSSPTTSQQYSGGLVRQPSEPPRSVSNPGWSSAQTPPQHLEPQMSGETAILHGVYEAHLANNYATLLHYIHPGREE